jgi:predicted transcriptional regulator
MQTLFEGRKIEEDDRKEAILEMISDKYCREILEATMDKPKSAMEISSERKIPISTVYRRLQSLHDNKLLGISGTISTDGKKYFLYKSKAKAISTSFNSGTIEIQIVPNTLVES